LEELALRGYVIDFVEDEGGGGEEEEEERIAEEEEMLQCCRPLSLPIGGVSKVGLFCLYSRSLLPL
jgi:hypothetical protein